MAAKFHINQKGEPAICGATTKPCPLKGEHFDNYEKAMQESIRQAREGAPKEDPDQERDYYSFGPDTVANAAEVLARFGLTVEEYGLDEDGIGDMDFYEDMEGLESGAAAWEFMSDEKKEYWTEILTDAAEHLHKDNELEAEEPVDVEPSSLYTEEEYERFRQLAHDLPFGLMAVARGRTIDGRTISASDSERAMCARLAEESVEPFDDRAERELNYFLKKGGWEPDAYERFLEEEGWDSADAHWRHVQLNGRRDGMDGHGPGYPGNSPFDDFAMAWKLKQKREKAMEFAPHFLSKYMSDEEAILCRREFSEVLMRVDAGKPNHLLDQTIDSLPDYLDWYEKDTQLFVYEKKFGKLERNQE